MDSAVFLKGYQWPFDAHKTVGGSSLIDILVYIETVMRGRRVFLDYRRNAEGFSFEDLSREALEYLTRSQALLETSFFHPSGLFYSILLIDGPHHVRPMARADMEGISDARWRDAPAPRRMAETVILLIFRIKLS
jgi:hypothetical protein